MRKKLLAMTLAMTMAASLAGCGSSPSGGSSGGSSAGGTSGGGASGSGVSFTIFNSKSEIQEHLEDAVAQYCKDNNVSAEVYYSNDTVAAHLSTKYASKEPYTLAMVDAKDVYSLGVEYGFDMTGAKWVEDTDYAITVDNKLLGFPVAIEARGILYNADAIKKITGEDFNPDSIVTLDDFDKFCQKLVDGGMESPTAILKPDWSLAAHYLQQTYEERKDPEAFVQSLYKGEANLIKDEKFNALMDTFDVLMKYNAFKAAPISAEDEMVHQKTSEGEVAFQFGGCWEWNDITDYEYTGNIGLMPVPQNVKDDYTGKLVGGGSKYFYIDNSENTSDEQRQAAMAFLEWLAGSDDGKKLISETCGIVSPFKSNTIECSNDLGKSVKKYVDAGMMVPNYDYDPDDHYSKNGAFMQEYLAGQTDRAGLASKIEGYWSSTTPVKH